MTTGSQGTDITIGAAPAGGATVTSATEAAVGVNSTGFSTGDIATFFSMLFGGLFGEQGEGQNPFQAMIDGITENLQTLFAGVGFEQGITPDGDVPPSPNPVAVEPVSSPEQAR